MRFLLPTVLALVSTQTPAADACGWQPPQLVLHKVSGHGITLADHSWTQRAFVVIGDAPEIQDQFWRQLAPGTYDNTAIADLSDRPARDLTLVGRSGVRVVTADHLVALKNNSRIGDHPRTAIEVPVGAKDDFQIALDGRIADVRWHDLEPRYSLTQPLAGTDLTVTGGAGGFIAKRGDRHVATGKGYVVGAFDTGGKRYLVADTGQGELAMTDLGVI